MQSFVDQSPTRRVVFGAGRTDEIGRLLDNARRILVVSTGLREPVSTVVRGLGERCLEPFTDARTHVPSEVAEAATELARSTRADQLLAIGGGTAVGTAKAIALSVDVPIAAIPTTYSGSEMTRIWGITDEGEKTTGRDDRVRPSLVVYDPELLATLPFPLARTSLFNALAHAAETLYDPGADESLLDQAEQAAASLVTGLRRLHQSPTDVDAASEALYGAYLAGDALDRASMALHHKLAHVLGGSFGTPHAETHAILLPHTLAHNLTPAARERLGRALGAADPEAALFDLALRIGLPTRLADVGFTAADVPRAVALALARPYPNPRPLTESGLTELLLGAIDGHRPAWSPA